MIKIIILQETEPDKCEYCGKIAELRPYRRNGAKICFECGMKDKETTDEMFMRTVFPEIIHPEQTN